ncbi:MAG: PEGA domain-containing protein [candidate division KSB1 bacterium]|jgi:hypothetical protein|nr:PEGA domain-containing protein [candidate division KSB1 bacterium]
MKKQILFLIILVANCGVKQPVDLETSGAVGSILVDSGEISGNIFLDAVSTGKTTPDTLCNVAVGPHIVNVYVDGHRSIPDSVNVQVEENKLSRAGFTFEKLIDFGYVSVFSVPSGAHIIVDGVGTGNITPDTVQLETGTRSLQLAKNGYQFDERMIDVRKDSTQRIEASLNVIQRVLLESFANVSCVPCVAATDTLHKFLNSRQADEVAVIEYFANWPSPNDPFYMVSPQDVTQRLSDYSVAALPALRIGGSEKVDPLDLSEMKGVFETQKANMRSDIGISIDKKLLDCSLTVVVEIHNLNGEFGNNPWRLYVSVIENNINLSSPPGSNGMTNFNYVFRTFLSSRNGDDLGTATSTLLKSYSISWPDWSYTNSKVIAFIQDYTTGEIIQSSIH